MSVANCPHCTAPVPAAFASMPVCTICGGDLSAKTSAPVWSSIDIKTDNTRVCANCGEKVKSILALDCPKCQASLAPAGKAIDDIEKEKSDFEDMVKSSNKKVETTSQVKSQTNAQEQESVTLKSNTSPSEVKSYSDTKKEKQKEKSDNAKIQSLKDKKRQKEGFFSKILRMLGLKKD